MSLCEPAIAKNECQIHVSWEATASRMTVHPSEWPLYCPCQPKGQFFHSQCMQSMLPSIPGKPLAALIDNRRAVSSALGCRRYCSPNEPITALQNLYIASKPVDSLMRVYSSTKSPATPYASILIAAVHFWYEERPTLPIASTFAWK